jgi:hypothetical protein
MVHQWVTKRSINNARRPGRGSMMRPTINEESDCLRKKNLRRRSRTAETQKPAYKRTSGLRTTSLKFRQLTP